MSPLDGLDVRRRDASGTRRIPPAPPPGAVRRHRPAGELDLGQPGARGAPQGGPARRAGGRRLAARARRARSLTTPVFGAPARVADPEVPLLASSLSDH